ncbi:MAG: hypothetical protein ACRDY0_04055 [Acidimicrobiales bacterium]
MLTLAGGGALAGGHCWSEQRLFQLLGAWVPQAPEADVKVVLDRHSAHCAWRAAQWRGRLPVMAGASPDELVVAPDRPWEELLATLGGDGGTDEGTVGRLAGAYRVALPRLAGAYRRHRAATTEVADGATRRSLDMALTDLVADWVEGEVLLQHHLGGAGSRAVHAVAQRVAHLEALLVQGSQAG